MRFVAFCIFIVSLWYFVIKGDDPLGSIYWAVTAVFVLLLSEKSRK